MCFHGWKPTNRDEDDIVIKIWCGGRKLRENGRAGVATTGGCDTTELRWGCGGGNRWWWRIGVREKKGEVEGLGHSHGSKGWKRGRRSLSASWKAHRRKGNGNGDGCEYVRIGKMQCFVSSVRG